MRISDWSSDVCSSDLNIRRFGPNRPVRRQRDAVDPLLRLAKPRLAVALQHDPPLIRGDGFIQRNLTALQVRHDRLEFAEGLLEAHPLRCRSEEHTSELQSLMRILYAAF